MIVLITAGNEDKYDYRLSESIKSGLNRYTDEKGIYEKTIEYRKLDFTNQLIFKKEVYCKMIEPVQQ